MPSTVTIPRGMSPIPFSLEALARMGQFIRDKGTGPKSAQGPSPQQEAMTPSVSPMGAPMPPTQMQSAHEPGAMIGAGNGFDMAMLSPIQRPDQLTQPLPSMPPMGSPERPQPQLRLEDILRMPQPDIMPLPEPTPWQTTGPHPGMAGLAGPGRMNPMSVPADYSPNYSPGSDPQFAQAPMQPFRMGGSGLDMAFQARGMQRPNLPPIQPAPSTMPAIDMGSLSPRDLMPSMSAGGAFMPPSEPNPESMTMDFGGETRFLDRRRPVQSPEESAMEDEENAFRSLERTAPPEVVFEAASKRSGNAAKAAGGGSGRSFEEALALKQAEPPGLAEGRKATLAAREANAQRQADHDLFMENLAVAKLDAGAYDNEVDSTEKMIADIGKEMETATLTQRTGLAAQREKLREDLAELHAKRRAIKVKPGSAKPDGGGKMESAAEATEDEVNEVMKGLSDEAFDALSVEERIKYAEKKLGKKVPKSLHP